MCNKHIEVEQIAVSSLSISNVMEVMNYSAPPIIHMLFYGTQDYS